MTLPDFPNNPTLNEQFAVGNNIYQWDGEKWKALSNADNSLRTQLADVDSSVLVGGIEAREYMPALESLKDLLGKPLVDGRQYSVKGFYAGSDVGGGIFYWDANRSKGDHDGGTVIDPSRLAAWDGTQSDLSTLFTSGSGSGCFVRKWDGGAISVLWFGAEALDSAGGEQNSFVFNYVLGIFDNIEVPDLGQVYAITDKVVAGKPNSRIFLYGAIKRYSSLSSSTSPVLQIAHQNIRVENNKSIGTENDSPDGVVLFGVESPETLPLQNNILWSELSGGDVTGAGEIDTDATLRKGIAFQTTQGYGTLQAVYACWVRKVRIQRVSCGIYLSAEANGNLFSDINFYFTGLHAVLMDGTGDGTASITDNTFVSSFVHFSTKVTDALRCIKCNRNNFFGWSGEGGAGRLYNFDVESTSNQFFGYDNYPNAPIDNGNENNISRNRLLISKEMISDSSETKQMRLWDSRSPSDFNRITDTINPSTYPTDPLGGILGRRLIEPESAPGSGNARFITWFANKESAGTTDHVVGFQGIVYTAGVYPLQDNTSSLGLASARYSEVFAATGAVNTSDGRDKQQIEDIDSTVLKAWSKVKFKQYKWNDAVDKKGEDGARWHFGVIAQQVKEAFESEGLDPFAYGLLCYDEWREEKDQDGNIIQQEGNRYGIRYDECLALECAYLRARIEGAV